MQFTERVLNGDEGDKGKKLADNAVYNNRAKPYKNRGPVIKYGVNRKESL